MYHTYMKTLIKYCLELSLLNIRTFTGYQGGDILNIETDSKHDMELIKKYCHKLEIDTNVKYKNKVYNIFCHFGKDIYKCEIDDDEIYELK